MNVFRPVALIPVYNHHQVIDELLDVLGSLDLPVILVDDGSNELCARSLDVSAASHRQASLVRLAKNGGKGAQACGPVKARFQRSRSRKTGSRGVPRRTPCSPTGRQGIVRYTALTTARENARPTL